MGEPLGPLPLGFDERSLGLELLGLLGDQRLEARPEAIMPLERGADGKLGVKSAGGGGGSGIGPVGYLTSGVLKRGLSDPEVLDLLAEQISNRGSRLNQAVRTAR